MANSGKAARSAPSSSARARARVIRPTLPSMSPTTVSSWHRATRTRDTAEAYRRRQRGPAWHAASVRSVLPAALAMAAERSAAPDAALVILRRVLEENPESVDRFLQG